MSLTFYYGSGSPPAWRVWLALEHKGIAYDAVRLHFDRGEHKSPEFLKVNPRGKVPAIIHDGFALAESGAILEYLEEAWPDRPLLPKVAKARARVRQLAREAGEYLNGMTGDYARLVFGRPRDDLTERLETARKALAEELPRWEACLTGDWLAGELSLADLTAYPSLRMLRRVGERMQQYGVDDLIGPRTAAWMGRIEALPNYGKTFPPHWKA
jgi:glutathione S-transferase